MFIIRFIFYVFITYIIMKMVRVFMDPVFESKTTVRSSSQNKPNAAQQPSQKQESKTTLGDYVDFEEIKS
ncbi:MAG: hypothetical protein JNM95_00385 [Chitinophagaceae bacterium]|nr:hypothetical protein [Chitinophagaceae bacterium]